MGPGNPTPKRKRLLRKRIIWKKKYPEGKQKYWTSEGMPVPPAFRSL
jgi:hypothetical protein